MLHLAVRFTVHFLNTHFAHLTLAAHRAGLSVTLGPLEPPLAMPFCRLPSPYCGRSVSLPLFRGATPTPRLRAAGGLDLAGVPSKLLALLTTVVLLLAVSLGVECEEDEDPELDSRSP